MSGAVSHSPDADSVRSDQRSHTRVVVVVGPTAVGKSALAEELALRLGGEIVSADSMQVYRGMDIGTAKTPVDQRRVAHHCLDLVVPGQPFSAALYQTAARTAIDDIAARGRVPILCGGTGLYVRAAVDDFVFAPGEQSDNPVREAYEALSREAGPSAVHELLRSRDPESAALIHPGNTRRVVRALEMCDEGISYARQQEGFSARTSIYDARFVGLTMERAVLYARIDERVRRMVDSGLLGEVEALISAGLRDALTASQAIGYKEFVPVLAGDVDVETAIEEVSRASRRYAKRQLTWFRADPRVRWIDLTSAAGSDVIEAALGTLDWSQPAQALAASPTTHL